LQKEKRSADEDSCHRAKKPDFIIRKMGGSLPPRRESTKPRQKYGRIKSRTYHRDHRVLNTLSSRANTPPRMGKMRSTEEKEKGGRDQTDRPNRENSDASNIKSPS